MAIKLTRDEALVLFEWLARTEETHPGYDGLVNDAAEQIVLWDLQCELERHLAAPLSATYGDALRRARAHVRGEPDSA
jgi:hypothetical protein